MRFEVLGGLAVFDGADACVITSPKGRLLLAELLLAPNRTVSSDALVDVLWGDDPPRTAGDSLHNHVRRLRQALGPRGGERLRFVAPGFVLRVDDGELDAADFTAHFRRALLGHSAGDWAVVRAETAAALALWRGQPLADLPQLGERPETAHLEELHLQLLEWRFDAEFEADRHHGSSAELVALTERYPMREAFHRQLMVSLHRTGRTAEALAVYQALRRTLVDELGSEPGPAIQAAHRDVLAADSPRPAAALPPDEPQPAPPLPAPFQLPAAISDFTGRRDELDAVTRSLSSASVASAPPVVVVSGMGGMGKTSLVLRAALGLRARFPDGQLYADLRGFGTGAPRTAHDLLARFLTDLGIDGPALPADADDRAALYRASVADRRLLIVLDNVRDTAQVTALIPGTGPAAVVVTSRHRLASLDGSTHIALGPLTEAEQRRLLISMCGAERVAADPESAGRILAACGGLPLAVRIAGAQLASRECRPLSTLARRLSQAGGRLTTLALDHLSVHDAFSASYDALRKSPKPLARAAARAFLLLGLWPAHALDLAAAAALLGETADRAFDLLDVLTDAHLLAVTEAGTYRLHDLLGEFAAEKAGGELPRDEREAAVLRVLHWYCAAAANANSAVAPHSRRLPPTSAEAAARAPRFVDEKHALAWYGRELPALTEAVRQAARSARPDLAWRIAVELFGYAQTYWWAGDLEQVWAEALSSAREHQDLQGQGRLHNQLGVIHGQAHRNAECVEHLRAAERFFAADGDVEGQASVLVNQALALAQEREFDTALVAFRQSRRLYRQVGREEMTGTELSTLGYLLLESGDAAGAEDAYRRSATVWRGQGASAHLALVLNNLGDALGILGRPEEAFAALTEGLAIRRDLGDEARIADSLETLARTHLHFANPDQARQCWLQALAIGHALHLDKIIADSQRGLATLATRPH